MNNTPQHGETFDYVALPSLTIATLNHAERVTGTCTPVSGDQTARVKPSPVNLTSVARGSGPF